MGVSSYQSSNFNKGCMIVETMTDLELYREVMKDFEEIANFYTAVRTNAAYKRRLQWGRPKDGQFVFKKDWKSSRGNTYTSIIKTSGWNEFKKGRFLSTTVSFFMRKKAQNALQIVFDRDLNPCIDIFTEHFIDRYNQRFLKQPFLSRKEVFFHFIDRNSNTVMEEMESSKYDYNVMMASSDGYSFCKNEYNGVIVHKTFVSREMLFGSQYETADFLDEIVIKAKNGQKSNIFDAYDQIWDVINSEVVAPTYDDIHKTMSMIEDLEKKRAALEKEGKEYDLEYKEMNNQLQIWLGGFDWESDKIRDEEGQLVESPLKMQIQRILWERNKREDIP